MNSLFIRAKLLSSIWRISISLGEYQIYFIKCVEKSDIFNSRDEINLVFTEKKK